MVPRKLTFRLFFRDERFFIFKNVLNNGGIFMKMSNLYMPTLKEVPAEAEIPSHQLLPVTEGYAAQRHTVPVPFWEVRYRLFHSTTEPDRCNQRKY